MKEQINTWLMRSMLEHSTIYPTASHVLMHAFFSNGNGYQDDFKDGVYARMLHTYKRADISDECHHEWVEHPYPSLEESRRKGIESIEYMAFQYLDTSDSDAIERQRANMLSQIEHVKRLSLKHISCTSSFEDMLEDVRRMFEYNKTNYTSKILQRFRFVGRELQDYRQLCDGFPSADVFLSYSHEEKYNYVPVFQLLKHGMNEEFTQIFLWFSSAILHVYKEMASAEPNKNYKSWMEKNIETFEEFMENCIPLMNNSN